MLGRLSRVVDFHERRPPSPRSVRYVRLTLDVNRVIELVGTHASGEPCWNCPRRLSAPARHFATPAGPGKALSTVVSRRANRERPRRVPPGLADGSWLPSLVALLTLAPDDRRLMSFQSYVLGASAVAGRARRVSVQDAKPQKPRGVTTGTSHKSP